MGKFGRIMMALILASGFALGTATYAAEDSKHGSGHTSGGKGKGPKYQGGDRGSHSSETHKGGSSHHDGGAGGSKSAESKIFDDHKKGGSSHEEGTEHSH